MAILADLFSEQQESGFLNGVDLSTQEGKQKYIDAVIRGENPFEKPENKEGSEEQFANINPDTITWSDIVRHADESSVVSTKANIQALTNPFSDSLLNLAFKKKLEEIHMETMLPIDEISPVLLERYSSDTSASTGLVKALKSIRNLSSSIFTECENCGFENQPGWYVCYSCGTSFDDDVTKTKIKKRGL